MMTDRFWFKDAETGDLVASPTFEAPPTIGSSDAAAILGLSPWSSPWDVWPRIVGLVPRYDHSDDASQARGRRLEPVILDWYADDYGVQIEPGPGLFREGDEALVRDGWAHDHPDAFEVEGPGKIGRIGLQTFRRPSVRRRAVEVKSVRWFDASTWGPPGSDQVPVYYLAQCAHHRFVTGLPVVLVAYATGNDELRAFEIDLDGGLVQHQAQLLKAWHDEHVVEGKPPPFDGTDACARGLARLYEYGDRRKDKRKATAREVELVREIVAFRDRIGQLALECGRRENALRDLIGESYGLEAPNGKTLAIWYPTTSLDEQALVDAHPDLDLDLYRKPGKVDRKALRKAHPVLEARHSTESGRTFKCYPENLPTPGEGEGEGW